MPGRKSAIPQATISNCANGSALRNLRLDACRFLKQHDQPRQFERPAHVSTGLSSDFGDSRCPYVVWRSKDSARIPNLQKVESPHGAGRPRRRGDRNEAPRFHGAARRCSGVAAAALAQQKAMPVIGWLGSTSPGVSAQVIALFRQGLSETGYVEGQNVTTEYRWAEGHYDRLPALAADLVGRKVDVIAAAGNPGILAAKSATSTIPIVFTGGPDPVAAGLVVSLAPPGGNLTGVTLMTTELMPKRLELLSELVPQASVIALLVNSNNSNAERMIQNVQEAAGAKGL